MEFIEELAAPADDAALRDLAARNPVPGPVALRYERSPSYFAGCGVMGDPSQALVIRHRPTGRIAAMACRSVRAVFVNGERLEVGYLGQLRVDRPFRARTIVARGFRLIKALDAQRRLPGYITTIIEGNQQALGILVDKPRPGMPRYRRVDDLCGAAIPVKPYPLSSLAGIEFRRGDELPLCEITEFLRTCGREKQFYPCYEDRDFAPQSPLTADFRVEDFRLAVRGGRIVGAAGLWDQSGYKQLVVDSYSGALRWTRPLLNAAARLFRYRPLPEPGKALRLAYASFAAVSGNDPAIFSALLGRLLRLASEKGVDFLVAGFSRRDPLLGAARRYPHVPYWSRLYAVGWEEQEGFHARLDDRIPYVEFAAL